MRIRGACCLFGFLCATVCVEGTQAPKSPMCQLVKFGSHVTSGEKYRQALGGDLTFVLMPSATGWWMEIEGLNPQYSSAPGNYLGIATPPYHFNTTVSIDDSYGTTLEEAVKNSPREFHFALNAAQYEQIGDAVDIALHGGDRNAAEQEKADDFIRNRMDEVTGSGKFSINSSQLGKVTGKKKDVILSLDFDVELKVPASFEASRDVAADHSDCSR